jgi:autotransporter-associated beta strand protein
VSLSRLPGAIGGSGTLTKSGTNLLHLLGANAYTGPTFINEGVLRPDKDSTFGPVSGGGVTIASGATLDLGCDGSVGGTRGADALNLGARLFTISGHGVNGAGAVVNNSGQNQMYALYQASLAGDTTFGGNRRWDFRNAAGVLYMNDNTLFKTGINEFCIITTTVHPGAGHFVVNQGLMRFESTSTLNGSAANTVTVNNGATLEMYNLFPAVPPYTAILNEHAQFRGSSGGNTATNVNVWGGSITLNGKAYFFGNVANMSWTATGDISGPGALVKAGNAASTFWMMSGNNTYGGGTIVSNGTLFAKYPGSLPDYNVPGKVSVVGGATLALHSYDGIAGWNAAQLQALHDNALFVTNTSALILDTTPSSVTYTGNLTQPLTLTKQGNNTLTLTGANSFNGPINVNGGDLAMNGGPNHRLGNVTIGNASVLVTSDAAAHTYATNTIVGNAAADFGRMTLAGSAVWGTVLPIQNRASPQLSVGNSGRGVFILQDNAVLTNKFVVGVNGGSHGAIYQRGNSFFHNWGGQGNDSRVGQNGYGYYELSGGTMTNNGYFQLGVGTTGIGILSQYGGAFRQATQYGGQFGLSRGGVGVVYLAGGTFASFVSMNVGDTSDNTLTGGTAIFTVDGTSDVLVTGNVNVGDRTNMFASVNLNGGTLTANLIAKGSRPTATALLGFDGGTYRARTSGNLFGANANTLDKVLVYAGGATLDSSNLAVTANANLLAPSGNGVASITLAPRGGYIGPPMVTITGGGGAGATALANFDSASGFVTGVTITSPGYDYLTAPTVTLSGGGTNLQTAVTGVTLAPNVSGGLTKRGTSTLTLSGTNTFGGALTLAEGTLKPAHGLAIPTGATLAFAGGTLDLNGMTLSNLVSTTSALSGSITNGTLRTMISPAGEYCTGTQSYGLTARASGSLQALYLADVTTDGACDVLAVQGDIDLGSYALQIVDLDGLDRSRQYTILTCTGTLTGAFAYTNLPDSRWKLYSQADHSLKLLFSDGMLLKIR